MSLNGENYSELAKIRMKIVEDEVELYKRSIVESRTAIVISIIAFLVCAGSALFGVE